MILTLTMSWRITNLSIVGWKEDTALDYVIGKDATKPPGFIAPRVLMKTQNFITVVDLTEIIQIWRIYSFKTNTACPFIQLIDVFASLPSFTSPVELIFALVLFLFHWFQPVPIPLSAMLEILTLYFIYWLFECMWWKNFQKSLLYWLSSCL